MKSGCPVAIASATGDPDTALDPDTDSGAVSDRAAAAREVNPYRATASRRPSSPASRRPSSPAMMSRLFTP